GRGGGEDALGVAFCWFPYPGKLAARQAHQRVCALCGRRQQRFTSREHPKCRGCLSVLRKTNPGPQQWIPIAWRAATEREISASQQAHFPTTQEQVGKKCASSGRQS